MSKDNVAVVTPGAPDGYDPSRHNYIKKQMRLISEGKLVKTDDSGRPKLRMRPHDIELGTFEEIIQRHRENALESAAFADAHKKFTQAEFPWGMT